MNNFRIAFVAIVSTVLVGCSNYTGEMLPVETDGTFSISYPDYFKQAKGIKPNAIVEYNNPYRNLYSFVDKTEKKEETFNQYQQRMVNVIKNDELLEMPLVTDSIFETLSFGNAIHIELYGEMQEENIYYWHSSFETKKFFYQVVVWTRSMDRKQRYGDDIEKIINSFEPKL